MAQGEYACPETNDSLTMSSLTEKRVRPETFVTSCLKVSRKRVKVAKKPAASSSSAVPRVATVMPAPESIVSGGSGANGAEKMLGPEAGTPVLSAVSTGSTSDDTTRPPAGIDTADQDKVGNANERLDCSACSGAFGSVDGFNDDDEQHALDILAELGMVSATYACAGNSNSFWRQKMVCT